MPSCFHQGLAPIKSSGQYHLLLHRTLCLLLFFCTEIHSLESRLPVASLDVDPSPDPCPVVLGCICINHDVTIIECFDVGPDSLPQLSEKYPSLYSLRLSGWTERDLQLDDFSSFQYLKKLSVIDSSTNTISISLPLPSITHLILDENKFTNADQFCNITRYMTSLVELSLNGNELTHLPQCIENLTVNTLHLRRNGIAFINGTFNELTRNVDLSWNILRTSSGIHKNMIKLNLSYNPLTEIVFPPFPTLKELDLSGSKFAVAPRLNAPALVELNMNSTIVEVVDFDHWILPSLQRLSMVNSVHLTSVNGRLPKTTKEFYVTNNQLASFPQSFFIGTSLTSLNLTGTNFDCESCVMQWSLPVAKLIGNQTKCLPVRAQRNCSLGISQRDPEIVRAVVGQSAILPCTTYGAVEPAIEWWLYRPVTFLGVFDPHSAIPVESNTTCCTVLSGGALQLHNVNRSMVERYVCIARKNGNSVHRIVRFRLDYSSWYSLDMFNSVFWGGIATAVLVCSFSFLLNITWILTRKSILWWIQRAERLSRVRKMVEAMEKYRAWKMESLHEKYTRRMNLVRENYHAQVEQLRNSYSSQAEKFRDYRAAQMENMSTHLENIRENYNQQLHRVREYGSRRAEQLWESYERQVNRMKAFSLQHRLKMMRQYKVKQKYMNNLLESFQQTTTSPEAMRRHEQEVKAALELIDPSESPEENHPLSHASSFYSLPEYVVEDNDVLRPSVSHVRSNLHSRRGDTHHCGEGSITSIKKQCDDNLSAEEKWHNPGTSKSQ
ncbi:hypothetical protein KIN20_007518 [Parelaphostrongylus tenuis]|uniref:Ig-like domain-containing protein n=1 Tax=Parelaphostrongylus tenuis TaxID=148309 RepID=A0AAD5M5M5_PARTN|nr:hypothetical protein KIN20_007518 [Parelaphostrongylus tenuis]